ncbi:hypothetical protein SESBI_38210 [Sesbania bispinosa]|nr:hypothetical protein SESBI_38210 [Sesbania bispinosa]
MGSQQRKEISMSKTNRFSLKRKCTKKALATVVVKNIGVLESVNDEEKRRVSDEIPSSETSDHKLSPTIAIGKDDNSTITNVLSNWRQMKTQRRREAARLKLEQIKNTAAFEDNMDAMHDFHKLTGCLMSYPTYTRFQCF